MQCVGIEIVVQNDFRRVSQEEFTWKEVGLSFRPRT